MVSREGIVPYYRQSPAYEGPSYEGPSYEGPSYEGPSYEGPSYEGPSYEGPSYEGPSYEGPSYEGPTYEGLLITNRLDAGCLCSTMVLDTFKQLSCHIPHCNTSCTAWPEAPGTYHIPAQVEATHLQAVFRLTNKPTVLIVFVSWALPVLVSVGGMVEWCSIVGASLRTPCIRWWNSGNR